MSEAVQASLKALEIPNDERLLVTCVDHWPGPDGTGLRVVDVPEWMLPNCKVAINDVIRRVIDIASTTGREIRWWQVVGYCRAHAIDHVPIYYDGVGDSAPAELLERAPFVAIRRSAAGPWILVRTPEMREELRAADATVKAVAERRAATAKETHDDTTTE